MASFLLIDSGGVNYGTLRVGRQDGDLILGDLLPLPAYDDIRGIFERYEQIINEQTFSLLDEIESQVESLQLMIVPSAGGHPRRIADVQIMSDMAFSCRLR